MIRSMYLLIDMSTSMLPSPSTHLPPSLPSTVLRSTMTFLKKFREANEIGRVGIACLRGGEDSTGAESVLSLTPSSHPSILQTLHSLLSNPNSSCSGLPSLQKGLEVVLQSLSTVPRHSSREILIIYSSITTSDEGITGLPGGLLDNPGTLGRLIEAKAKVHVICLNSEVRAARVLAERTGGTFHVPLNNAHLSSILTSLVTPPPAALTAVSTCQMVEYGFPQQITNDVKTLVGGAYSLSGYSCPRCRHMSPSVPCACEVCGLRLILPTNLAKSYHHLFPPPNTEAWKEGGTCVSCGGKFKGQGEAAGKRKWGGKKKGGWEQMRKCKECKSVFCTDCDNFRTTGIFNCVGCLNEGKT
ncbi:hypothetical protein TrRE_jg10382 [Triparma retinervis]|uniref:TFIIH C1-like domain-containing protein n=1 Tax=Triparma retinervis TaxID=2557542 RepID=A0A9W7DV94_9STRA|nr:hypothetical protein TrRE_jg10382 [Triparma retinervis]